MSESTPTISATVARALEIIRDQERLGFYDHRSFAKRMWPDSEAWQNAVSVGHGTNRGAGMARAAGGFLGKLQRQDLITIRLKRSGLRRYELTAIGAQALAAWQAAQPPAEAPSEAP